MKRNYKKIILLLLLAGIITGWKIYRRFENRQSERLTIEAMLYMLNNYHYLPRIIDDSLSRQFFDEIIKRFDPSKRYFLASDIVYLSRYRDSLDNQITEARFDFFDAAYGILIKRQKEAAEIYRELIAQPIDLNEPDTLNTDYDTTPFPTDKQALRKRWKAFIKYSILTDIASQMDVDRDSSKTHTDEEYRQKGTENTKKNFDNFFENLNELERADYLAIYFNTFAELYDPHTNYFKPSDRDRFNVDMAGSFEGIGARLQKEGPYTKIVELIPGGPAWRDGKLEVGDIILKVRQQNEEQPIDAVGMRLDKLVRLIKGPKGTTVYLTVKKLNGNIVEIPIVRDKVILKETFAKSLLIKNKGRTFGYILLPKFYHDFEHENARNSASDMKKELKKLLRAGAEGVIIDLRNNGGGSLADVIKIGGYFIPSGPIVQVRNHNGQVRVLRDRDHGTVIWNKPVVVLVNELSASASEILAAALQDYKRAVIIGGKQTYGKGTVQRFIDLNQLLHLSKNNIGSLKWTIQKFYRINGNSTQRNGVKPDISLPDRFYYLDNLLEKGQKTAMPFDMISPTDYHIWNGYTNFEQTVDNIRKTVDTMKIFRYMDTLALWFKQNNRQKIYPLQKNVFLNYLKQNQAKAKRLDSLIQYDNHLHFESLAEDTVAKTRDTVFQTERKRWIENLQKDPYVEQAVNALQTLQTQ